MEFKRIELSDRDWINERLAYSNFGGCEYCFGSNYIWQEVYEIRAAMYKDFYVVRNKNGYLYPAGKGDIKEVAEQLRNEDGNIVFTSMDRASMENLVCIYGDKAETATDRDLYDYVYEFESLRTLKGKKLHSKRNHVNRFKDNNWVFEPITPENIEECKVMNDKWCVINECELDKGKMAEMCAVRRGLAEYFDIGFKGGLLRADGAVQAFTFGERLNKDTFVVHAEKAFTDYQGAYPAINFEFINSLANAGEYYKFVNREEDMGLEGLRKAKLSYSPAEIFEKYKVVIHN